MVRNTTLTAAHYAAKWTIPSDNALNDTKAINGLAIRYAQMAESPAKQDIFLQLVRSFHGYLMKYTNMVIRGQMPAMGTRAYKDATGMLKTLMPKGMPINHTNLSASCRMLHLAFKQFSTDDVYDVMVLCFLRATRRYDPEYTVKVQQVCEAINANFSNKLFTPEAVTESVGFDSTGCLRLLVRKGYLVASHGAKKKVLGYQRGQAWPPPESFFQSGPIGFTYFIQMWFRYYLKEHISEAMGAIETQGNMLQLKSEGKMHDPGTFGYSNLPSSDGKFTDRNGVRWSADISLLHSQQDVSEMTDSWVQNTTDPLFSRLSPRQRYLLQMIFLKEYNWVQIAALLGCSAATARHQYQEVLEYLQNRANQATTYTRQL